MLMLEHKQAASEVASTTNTLSFRQTSLVVSRVVEGFAQDGANGIAYFTVYQLCLLAIGDPQAA